MIDHVSVGVDDIAKSCAIYDAALAALSWSRVFEFDAVAVSYGPAEMPIFWVQKPLNEQSASAGNGTHVCLSASSRAAVDAFHKAALENGATDAGAPGLRPEYHPNYYGAFFYDLTGNKIEAAYHGE